ncbi:PAS domain-containing protein [Pseudomonas oryzihabitans]|uniref:PAS domain-containing protein n=1 Tax=Pseudomonas oryzihabitans TaxID=47885 RepID=UPI00119CD2E4|nr:PAS domain-containing protein [Pseudomonas psychrotolerans]
MSADWRCLYELSGGDFIANTPLEDLQWLNNYVPLEDHEAVRAEIVRARLANDTYRIEHRIKRNDGEIGWARFLAMPLFDDSGEIVEWLGTVFDNTHFKQIETALREGETRLRLAIEAGLIGEWELDIRSNTSVRALRHDQIFGYSEPVADWGIETFLSHVFAEDLAVVTSAFDAAAASGNGWNFQCRIRRKDDGSIRWIAAYSAPQFDQSGQLIKLHGMVQDITAHKAAEAALRTMNETLEQQVIERTAEVQLYSDIIQSHTAPICAFDNDFKLIAFNQSHSDEFYRIYGYRVRLGEVFHTQLPAGQADIMHGFMRRALRGEVFTVTERFGDSEIAKPYWELSYTPLRDKSGDVIGAFHYARDVTDKLRAETELNLVQEALRQSQKMEAVGQLTGGLAHDFNNLLAGISGSLELMHLRLQQNRFQDVQRYVAIAQNAAQRAAALTHRLLAFSRRQTLKPKPTDVALLAHGMLELIQRTVGKGMPITVRGSSSDWPTLVDRAQLENALVNLCINARDAMPSGGEIVIKVDNAFVDGSSAARLSMREGQYVRLVITDNGEGMPPEVISRAFEPFFTTKPTGQGTGLGLSMIYGFVQQSGGSIHLESKVGQGTDVIIYLPRYDGVAEKDVGGSKPLDLVRLASDKTVLVVDDEPSVRTLLMDILIELGYAAIEAADSASGLKLLQSDLSIDLLVTDVGLPGGMNGRQMADAALVSRPTLKVLFITGYADSAVLGGGCFEPGLAVMTKPFTVSTIAARIRALVDGSQE